MRYALHGFVVETSASVSLLHAASADDESTLIVRYEDAAQPRELASESIQYRVVFDDADGVPYWTVARFEDSILLRVHNRADFFIRGGDIDVVPYPNVDPVVVEQVLVDLVAPRALHSLGFPCLHASAVRLGSGRVVAFTAEAGTGKSTLCAALVARGGELLSDDAIAPRVEGDEVVVPPAYPSLRLWTDSAVAVFGHDDFPTAARHRKHRVTCAGAEAAPLHGIFCLQHDPRCGAPAMRRMSASEALQKLATELHRLVSDDPRACAAEFELLAELVARVPVYELSFPHDYAALDQLVQLIEDA